MTGVYELELRHRADADEPIRERHRKFMEAMSRFPPPLGCKGHATPDVPNIGEIVSVVPLRALSKGAAKSYISYKLRSRSYLKDNAQYDDGAFIQFRPDAVDLKTLLNDVFPAYIEALDCYKATIAATQVRMADWDRVVELCNSTGKDVDGRDGVYRIHPGNFFDRELCKRAFGLAPEKIVERLRGKVETASLIGDGVLLVCSSKLPLPREEYEQIDARVKAALK